MNTADAYRGTCSCGAVELAASGKPMMMGYCHCGDCRGWLAAPVNAFTVWPPDKVRVSKGEEQVGTFNRTERSLRKFCQRCSGRIMVDHPKSGFVEVSALMLPDLAFEPRFHLYYSEKTVPIRDGLPKFKDLPEELGGSGETLPE